MLNHAYPRAQLERLPSHDSERGGENSLCFRLPRRLSRRWRAVELPRRFKC